MKKIILVTGGERSGKSTFAEQKALELSDHPVYVATARIWDEEFCQRVRIHKERRGKQWTNIEEEKYLSRHNLAGRTVLIDCITLWTTNFFFDHQSSPPPQEDHSNATIEEQQAKTGIRQVEDTLRSVKEEFIRFTDRDATFIFVTNEIGMGGVSANAVQRRFTDVLGWINQFVAAPVKIK